MEMVTVMLKVAAVQPSEDHCLRSLLRMMMTVMVVHGDDDGNDYECVRVMTMMVVDGDDDGDDGECV
eukprot:618885-Pyramimonas_sp.AAC.1